ncbi:stage III sporulation protein AE [Sporosarcina pasteurii]|uniref:Stage III sporulation protein AE n=1 Tax=Sporosarcina pasteurii TaxID=1474 RepID=A0A380BPI6_SPOPA|nr:stage III sporulation protein AE [Sporosarcina pasteurii]MDS9471099.1 stage III sporulation protein AE [Sporosarcina pasteurii]QBQ05258.1 stage III sporulation protein AE [Sporosarcina pasteurii]SUJ04746.1 Stage III sporulation protein AE precursor [Sporosarcina pasteurii]
MITFLDSILGSIISSFAIIILSTFMALFIDFLFPSFKKWTRIILFFIVISVALQPAFQHFILIRNVAYSLSSMFIGIYPIITASILAAGGTFNFLNFQPAMLLFANGSILLADKLLIPLLATALLLDVATRLLPDVPFTRLAELIRTTLFGTVTAVVTAYSIFITVGGTMSWALSGIASEPVKELIQQNIPIIGSFMTESIGSIGRYSSGVTVFVGGWIISAVWTVALVPSLKTLVTALFYRWIAALVEPFTNEDITGLLDDIGKTLLVLCAISFLLAFAFIYTAIFVIILVKLLTVAK